MIPRPIAWMAILALAGCGGGGGAYSPPATPEPPDPPEMPDEDFVALNLTTGAITIAAEPRSLRSDAIIFRRIGGTAPLSPADAVGPGGTDDTTASATVATTWVSIHEVSQAQWALLAAGIPASASPWTAYAASAGLGGAAAVTAANPAFGVSWTTLQAVLASWNAGTGRPDLRAPFHDEWEFACRAGAASASRYHWGAAEDATTAATYARVRETRGSQLGPAVCGARTANALGFHDMSGNVWEWATDGVTPGLRGGSWHDNLGSAASGNRMDMGDDIPYPTAGVRLVMETP